ncbi:hypothetical protein GCM10010339_17570 [Streptomyces alanosinicus]|uniref:YncE family protein n=1 Tax=Streptomyces alanosinicus TaxID=68171 RepID=A0A918YEB1_9ACTN|nr:YncE family protein [Streptomyces alanosinicus]GHE00855.1 hypothetical protein GCM10010339_17570 [Streptomyces alanosinicus]
MARRLSPRTLIALAAGLVVAIAAAVAGVLLTRGDGEPPKTALPLRPVTQIALPGDNSRFDYASLDPGRGLLFIAHLGAGEVIEVDVRTNHVVRVIGDLPGVHGVLVVPALHRVYATASDANQVATIDETTGSVLHRSPTGDTPDGLAYDPVHGTVWTTNETGGSETVVDATTGAARGTVTLGGEAGNVAYDPSTRQMLVDVQTRNELAVIDPATLHITRRVPLPGCDHDHGLTLAPADRLAFVACDGNARLLTVGPDHLAHHRQRPGRPGPRRPRLRPHRPPPLRRGGIRLGHHRRQRRRLGPARARPPSCASSTGSKNPPPGRSPSRTAPCARSVEP